MTETAEVVVIGGGAVGTSTAFHLAELGITDVMIIERNVLASGSTSKAAGGIRLQFPDETNIRIGLRSLDAFVHFHERMDVDINFRQHGYLFLLDSAEQLELFRDGLRTQNALGVPSRELTPPEILEIVPQVSLEGIVGATYCPLDGQATPEALVQGFARRAADAGVRIRQSCTVEGIEVSGGRIVAVQTNRGRVATGTVICAAGAWSREIAAMVGIELPVTALRRTLFYSPDDGGLPADLPLTIDFSTRFHILREGKGIVFGGPHHELDELAAPAIRRFPFIDSVPIQSSWWGYYEMSPDSNGIIGEADGPGRFLFATGFSGHGFQQSPCVGEHVAELVAGHTPTVDLTALGLDRFEGANRITPFVI